MSKSLGNFILARDFIKDHDANVVKIVMFKTHYRLPLNITDELFNEAKIINEKVYNALKQANLSIQLNNLKVGNISVDDNINKIMDEDFNTPNLISYMMELVKELNANLRSKKDICDTYDKLKLVVNILGLVYNFSVLSESDIDLYNKWVLLKNNKDFEHADIIRKELESKGIL